MEKSANKVDELISSSYNLFDKFGASSDEVPIGIDIINDHLNRIRDLTQKLVNENAYLSMDQIATLELIHKHIGKKLTKRKSRVDGIKKAETMVRAIRSDIHELKGAAQQAHRAEMRVVGQRDGGDETVLGFARGVKLRAGDMIGRTGLEIPRFGDPTYRQFLREARTFADNTTGKERVGRFVKFVNGYFKPGEPNGDPMRFTNVKGKNEKLLDAFEKKVGMCRHQAAALQMLLQSEGIESWYTSGHAFRPTEQINGLGHAWVRVKINGEDFLADPANLRFGKYDNVSAYLKHVEYETWVVRKTELAKREFDLEASKRKA